MKEQSKENLINEWKTLRAVYFGRFEEDTNKFEKSYCSHPLYKSVLRHLNKSFREINQIAEKEIQEILDKNT